MRSWLMLVMVTAVVMIAAPSAGAQAVELPVGNANGVRIVGRTARSSSSSDPPRIVSGDGSEESA